MILKRRSRQRSGIQRVPRKRFPQHRAWVRGFPCAAKDAPQTLVTVECGGPIEAAHVRNGTDGGMGEKPSDWWCLSLCQSHHRRQHLIGETEFERQYGINMRKIAEELASRSPHRKGWENG